MTKQRYTELRENLIDSYCREWPDTDIWIPSFEQAQEQEILESEELEGEKDMKVKTKNTDIDEQFKMAFDQNYERPESIDETGYACVQQIINGQLIQTQHSKLDERENNRTLERQKKGKVKNIPLTEAEQAAFDEACGVKKVGRDREMDEAFAQAFGNTRGTERLQELKESIGNDSEGRQLLETVTVDWIEEDASKPFTFRGKAVKVDRKNQNSHRYRREITERALKESRVFGENGGVLTVMSGHPQPNSTDPSVIVGKVSFGDIGVDNWMPYEAQLSNTSLGMDLQKLLRDKCIGDVSLRSRGRTAMVKVDGESVEDVTDLHFKGLDLVIAGAEEGAGVDEILNADKGNVGGI